MGLAGYWEGAIPGTKPEPDRGKLDPSISDLSNIPLFTVKRQYEPINLHNSSNKPQIMTLDLTLDLDPGSGSGSDPGS